MTYDAEKKYTMLGFAQKAGKIASGENTVEAKLKEKSACLIVVAEDAPEHTKDRMRNLAVRHHVDFLIFGEKNRLGQSIGKSPRNVVLVSDKNFATQIKL
ncbi:MAG: ribosomal L7Ae/L30e/S12e/Gadd45 family protein [Firmicutes bacterium]|nr:ribosomal L7Ae/L30e/S12e/Gadd45 family protein [Bacillota bacterium]MBQ4092011.1 ribosomal L7Ae/L30e/S12e/Gadd45 family protein [Bacillota bacterium]